MSKVSNRPRRETVDLFVPSTRGAAARGRARRFFSDKVIAHPALPDIPFDKGQCFRHPLPRTHGRYLHGMLFLADWHNTILAPSRAESRTVRTVAEIFLSWQEAVNNLRDPLMAYHDETTAKRLMHLARFLDDHAENLDSGQREDLAELAGSTARLLLDSDFYAGANNHGMFQDLALLRYAAGSSWLLLTPDVEAVTQVALARLMAYFRHAFSVDGAHVENSPGYHLMVSRFLRDVLPIMEELAVEGADELGGIYRGAEKFAVHSILPNGELPPLGDTKVVRVRETNHRSTFTSPEYRFAITEGLEGRAPSVRSVVFPHGGYAFHRTSWLDPQAYAMTFKAAYLSGYHHHNDDLALTVFGRGRWLLTEAGPYGYDYEKPLTKYAFSQFAHNVIVIDGRSLPRTDSKPGGVTLKDLGEPGRDYLMRARGRNTRYPAARHTRDVIVREPNGNLEISVADVVRPDDGAVHDYRVLWHVGPDVNISLRAEGAEFFVDGAKVLELSWSGGPETVARMVRPRETGRVRAIRFPEFGRHEPGTVIEVAARGATLSLKTVIRSGNWVFDN